jgi:hypothetical protein
VVWVPQLPRVLFAEDVTVPWSGLQLCDTTVLPRARKPLPCDLMASLMRLQMARSGDP